MYEAAKIGLMNRYVVAAAAVALPLVVVAVAMGLRGGDKVSSTLPSSTAPAATISLRTEPTTTKADLKDGRHFGLIKSVDLATSPGAIVFDVADLLTGEAANQYAAARGWEVPVANDSLIANDDPRLRTLRLSPDTEIFLMDWTRCCEPALADREQLAVADVSHAWGYWITLKNGVVVKVEEQYHP